MIYPFSAYRYAQGGGLFAVLIGLALVILTVIAQWNIFEKAGEPGWKALVPIYRIYILYKITWTTSIFWLQIILSLLSVIPFFGFIFTLASYILSFMAMFRMSAAFGHGLGYAIGLFFLNPLFVLIIGLGRDRYQGSYYR